MTVILEPRKLRWDAASARHCCLRSSCPRKNKAEYDCLIWWIVGWGLESLASQHDSQFELSPAVFEMLLGLVRFKDINYFYISSFWSGVRNTTARTPNEARCRNATNFWTWGTARPLGTPNSDNPEVVAGKSWHEIRVLLHQLVTQEHPVNVALNSLKDKVFIAFLWLLFCLNNKNLISHKLSEVSNLHWYRARWMHSWKCSEHKSGQFPSRQIRNLPHPA